MSTQNPFTDALNGERPDADTPSAGTVPDAPPAVDEELPETIEENAPSVTDNEGITTDDIQDSDGFVENVLNGMANRVAEAASDAFAWCAREVASMFTHAPNMTISETDGSVGSLVQMMVPFTVVVILLSFLALAARLGMATFRHDPTAGPDIARFITTTFLVSVVFFPFMALLASLSDNFATGVIDDATMTDAFGDNLLATMELTDPLMVAIVILGYFIVMFLSSLVILAALYLKVVAFVILVGLLPFMAGISGTRPGMGAFMKHVGWIFAFLAIEPAMALVYAHGFNLMGERPITEGGMGMFTVGVLTTVFVALTPFAVLSLVWAGFSALSSGGGAAVMGTAAGAARFAGGVIDRRTGKMNPPSGSGGEGGSSRHTQSTSSNTATGSAQPGARGSQGATGSTGASGTSRAASAAHTGARAAGGAKTAGAAAAGTAAGGPAGGAAAAGAAKGASAVASGSKKVSRASTEG